MQFINIGFGNLVNKNQILAMITPDSAPARRLIQKARDEDTLIDATQGRKTRCILICLNGNLVLSALHPDTIASRETEHPRTEGGEGAEHEN